MLEDIEKTDQIECFSKIALEHIGLNQGTSEALAGHGQALREQICPGHVRVWKKALQFSEDESGAATMLDNILHIRDIRDSIDSGSNAAVSCPEPGMTILSREQGRELCGIIGWSL